jgi:hypothetical protein
MRDVRQRLALQLRLLLQPPLARRLSLALLLSLARQIACQPICLCWIGACLVGTHVALL